MVAHPLFAPAPPLSINNDQSLKTDRIVTYASMREH